MMKYFSFFYIIPALLFGDIPLAPLMPLIPGDPLELYPILRHELYEVDQSSHNLALFKSYSFPWLSVLFVLIVTFAAPFLLYILQKMTKKRERPSFLTLLEKIKALQFSPLPPKELSFEVAKLFKMGFENGAAMTYQELLEHLQESRRYSVSQVEQFKEQFDVLEKLQFQLENPTFEKVTEAIQKTEGLLDAVTE